jgi:hypothetical protein
VGGRSRSADAEVLSSACAAKRRLALVVPRYKDPVRSDVSIFGLNWEDECRLRKSWSATMVPCASKGT